MEFGGSGNDSTPGGLGGTRDDGLEELTEEESNDLKALLQNIPIPPGAKTPSLDEVLSDPRNDSLVDAWFATARTAPELARQAFLDPNSGWQDALEDLGMPESQFLALANQALNPTEFVNQLAEYINDRRDVLRGDSTDVVTPTATPTSTPTSTPTQPPTYLTESQATDLLNIGGFNTSDDDPVTQAIIRELSGTQLAQALPNLNDPNGVKVLIGEVLPQVVKEAANDPTMQRSLWGKIVDFGKGVLTAAQRVPGIVSVMSNIYRGLEPGELNTGEQEILNKIRNEVANDSYLANEIQRLLNRVPAPTSQQDAGQIAQIIVRASRLLDPTISPETEPEVVPSDDPDWERFKRRIFEPIQPVPTTAPTTEPTVEPTTKPTVEPTTKPTDSEFECFGCGS